MRLIDGPYRSEGRLQLYFFGVWGGVCGGSFGAVEADAVCNRLGYTRSRGTRAVSRYVRNTVLYLQLSVFVTESVKTGLIFHDNRFNTKLHKYTIKFHCLVLMVQYLLAVHTFFKHGGKFCTQSGTLIEPSLTRVWLYCTAFWY